jgi:anti-sigma factor RsiW
MNCQEYREIVAAHVDNVLTPTEREEAERHVASCPACRQVYEQEKDFRAFMAAKPLLQKVPPALEQNLRSALAQAERTSRRTSWWSWLQETFTFPRLAVGLATAGLLALFLLPHWFAEQRSGDFLQRLTQDYTAAITPGFSLAFPTDDLQALEAYYNRTGTLDFRAHLPDLRKQGYRLKGGAIVRADEKVMTATLFEGQKGYVLCRLLRGTASLLPPGGERMGKHLFYTRGDFTLCFTQEGETLCCLITRIPRETFVHDLEALFS